MAQPKPRTAWIIGVVLIAVLLALVGPARARSRSSATRSRPLPAEPPPTKSERQDDSITLAPSKDLALQIEGEHKADALAHFVEGISLEETGEMDRALTAYRKVLDLDPGQSELATRVAGLLTREEDFPHAIDILKDAIKANPKAAEPFVELAFIYAKYLKRPDQAIDYINRAITIDPQNIDAYERLYEITLASGDEKKALQALDRAFKVRTDNPAFWSRLGKLYIPLVFKGTATPKPEELAHLNEIFKKAADHAQDDPTVLRDVADYYAASQQIKEAIPYYLRLLELEPDDASAREKLAAGFAMTNQRDKAVKMLEEIIAQHPEKYQPYDLLAGLFDDSARTLERTNHKEEAKAGFRKAAANYEQSVLINPDRAAPYLHLAEILLGPLKDSEKAVKILTDARQHFSDAPELVYYLGIAQREAKHAAQAVGTFEEALHESELEGSELANARFYFDYGAAAEQAGLYDKAADLFRKSIALDPPNAADAYNYLAYMWAEHDSHLEEAQEMIKHALELDAENGAYLDTLGWIEFQQGKFEQALSHLLRASQAIKRDDPVILEHIGDTYSKLNKMPQALDQWQRALTLDPGNKQIAEKIDNAKTKMSKGEPTNANPLQ